MVYMVFQLMALPSLAQSDQYLAESTIHQFALAAEKKNVSGLNYLLHENFLAIINNQMFIKEDYVRMLRDERIGGVPCRVEVQHADMLDNRVYAKVKCLRGNETIALYFQLFKNKNKWQVLHVLQDQPQKM